MLSFFPPDVLDEIWDLIESVSEGFLTYCVIRFFFFVFMLMFVVLMCTFFVLVLVLVGKLCC